MNTKTDIPAEKCSSPSSAKPVKIKEGHRLFLIDSSAYIFRAFHALPPLTRPSDGLPVGAVHGYCQMIWKLLQEQNGDTRPTHMAAVFDYSSHTFRNDFYPEYKANRSETPEELVPQFPLIRTATRAFNIACVEQEGVEADDIIATWAREADKVGAEVVIVSSDKDLMQLVSDNVTMLDTMKNRRLAEPEVHEKFGVGPERVIDVQALAGDSTDNVPGVPGIGVKTAAQLINEYGDLETLLSRAEEIKQNKRRENLIEFAEQARISYELVKLKDDVDVEIPLAGTAVAEPDPDKLLPFLQEMEFATLTKRVATGLGAEAPAAPEKSVGSSIKAPPKAKKTSDGAEGETPAQDAAHAMAEAVRAVPIDVDTYTTVTSLDDLQSWLDEARETGYVAFDTETDSLDAMQANLIGISLAVAPGRACYVPMQHGLNAGGGDLFGESDDGDTLEQIAIDQALPLFKDLLEDEGVLKIGQNLKYDLLVMRQHGVNVAPIDDTMLLSYVLDNGLGKHGMDELADRHLGHKCIPFKEIAGSGKKMITFDLVPIDQATRYAAEDADITLRLWQILKPRLVADRVTTVYETLERPLTPVLVDMEREGILADRDILSRLSSQFSQSLARLESEIYEMAGKEFNIGSPKQLGEILFDEMKMPGGKKTKTGAWATGASIIEDLANSEEVPEEHTPFLRTMLEWRQLSKLKSTYTDALQNYINPQTKRIHTSYSMASTSTGRLASSEPNLQNIPVRTKEGREIRTAFVAPKGAKLISADYSQIELRVLAHIADIPALKKAFADGLDIHAMTASEMFGVPIEGMDPMIRRRAKAINFGIIYGISAFGLANQLSIPRSEAGEYIKTYFARFPEIKDYMETTKQTARDKGYVETLFGRRIYFPQIDTKNWSMRAFQERAAINAPIQGSAADIIRRAMVRMPDALGKAKSNARMLLQVHDELIFEVPEKQVKKTIKTAREVMEKACAPALELAVPLKVDAEAADNWEAAH